MKATAPMLKVAVSALSVYRMVYLDDPSENVLDNYSHSYELTYSAGAHAAKV